MLTLEPAALFADVAAAAKQVGVPAYVVGGWVRDRLMGRPSKDVDIVCVGDGIALAEAFAARQKHKPEVASFKTFGTAMVRAYGMEVEFVGARRESYVPESRKPDVEPGTLPEDLARRDFTINAMAVSLNEGSYGELLDIFDGQADMDAAMLRTPLEPEVTFSDDPLRMMRAVRFAAQLGYDIAPDTFEAIQAQKERLKIVSVERIITEFNKMLMVARPSYGLRLAYYAGLLEQFFPEITALAGVENVDGKSHKDNFFHTLEVLDNVVRNTDEQASLWLRWAALLHDIAKPATKRFDKRIGWTFHGHEALGAKWAGKIFRRLKLPLGEELAKVQNLVRLHLRPIPISKEEVSDSAVRRLAADAGADLDDLMVLVRADVTTKNPTKAKRYLENFAIVEQKIAQVDEADRLRNFRPALHGEVLMARLGLSTANHQDGILVGQILKRIREDLLDGIMPNTEEACWARVPALLPAAWQGLRDFAKERGKEDQGEMPEKFVVNNE